MTRKRRRFRVLLVAEECNPEWVSVPLVGWSHFHALSKITRVHLVTQVRNREAIERAELVHGRDFTAIDSERVARPIWRIGSVLRGGKGKGWTTVMALNSLSYYYFERLVWKQFGRRIRAGEFDIVHRITPLSPTAPSIIAGRCRKAGVPFILGPLNGGVPWPREFDRARRQEKEWLSYVRSAYKLLPGYRATRRHASAILIGSKDTWKQIPARYHEKCVYMPENAIDPSRFSAMRTRKAGRPIRAVFIGRLVPYKGADMLMEAAAPLIRSGDIHLKIIGDGPQMPEIKAIIERQRISDGVELAGWVEHRDVQHHLAEADVLTFPSIREFGGGVVLEAMAVGVVPLIVKYGGPAELVTEETGYLVPIGSREHIIQQFRHVLQSLSDHPEEIDAKSRLARERTMSRFTWRAKAQQTLDVYRSVLGQDAATADGTDTAEPSRQSGGAVKAGT